MSEEINASTILEETERDPRDYDLTRFIPYRETISNIEFMLDLPDTNIILDQGRYGACGGFALALSLSIYLYQRTHKWIDFAQMIFYGTRYDDDYQGVGVYLRQLIKVLYKEGAFFRRDFNIMEEMPELKRLVKQFKENNPDLVEQAKIFCPEGYAFIERKKVEGIQSALEARMGVIMSIDAAAGMGNIPGGYIDYDMKFSNTKRHAVTPTGWCIHNDRPYWIIPNSWGEDSGDRGILYIDCKRPIYDVITYSFDIVPVKTKRKRIEFVMGSSEFTADGEVKTFETAPYIKNGRTYLPVRFVAENLGASVEWNAETGTATIRSEEAIITISDRSNVLTINGEATQMDVCPEIANGRMMAPIRFIAQALNCTVDWEKKENKAVITAL